MTISRPPGRLSFYITKGVTKMARKKETLADKIVKAVLEDLAGRSGIGNALEECDQEIQREIKEELTEKVQAVLTRELHKS